HRASRRRTDPRAQGGVVGRCGRPGLRARGRTGIADRMVVQSFSVVTLETCRDMLPMVTRFLLRMVPKPEDIAIAREVGAVAINPSYKGFSLGRSVVTEIRDNGLGVFVWTVDGMNEWRELLDAGVDGIITNHPGRLQGFLAGRFDPVA